MNQRTTLKIFNREINIEYESAQDLSLLKQAASRLESSFQDDALRKLSIKTIETLLELAIENIEQAQENQALKDGVNQLDKKLDDALNS